MLAATTRGCRPHPRRRPPHRSRRRSEPPRDGHPPVARTGHHGHAAGPISGRNFHAPAPTPSDPRRAGRLQSHGVRPSRVRPVDSRAACSRPPRGSGRATAVPHREAGQGPAHRLAPQRRPARLRTGDLLEKNGLESYWRRTGGRICVGAAVAPDVRDPQQAGRTLQRRAWRQRGVAGA